MIFPIEKKEIRLLFKTKEYIVDERPEGFKIRNCDSNVAKMNLVEHMIFNFRNFYPNQWAYLSEFIRDAIEGIGALLMCIVVFISLIFPFPLLFVQSIYKLARARKTMRVIKEVEEDESKRNN
jgi:hypothetical protein